MSRRSKASESAVSLFPFLAVLMCTMGALILLLIAMTNKIRQQAISRELAERAAAVAPEEEASPPPAAEPPARPRLSEEERERILAERHARRAAREAAWTSRMMALRADRDQVRADLDERRAALTKLERKLRMAASHAEKSQQETEAARTAREASVELEQKLKGLEEQVVEQIEATRRNIDLERRKRATASNEYALVPYDGTSGTMRRPIYIECTKNGYRFIPENEYVGPQHLDGFSENYNPLLTGTQALLRYWNQRRLESGGKEPEPYVLLIVRPSGSLAYYLARKLLAPVGANFGYELVEEDWKLATGQPDPRARAALHNAIEVTVDARQKLRESVAASGGGRQGALSFNSSHRAISRNELNEGFGPDGQSTGLAGARGGIAPRDDRGEGGGSPATGALSSAADGAGATPRSFADRPGSRAPGGFGPSPEESLGGPASRGGSGGNRSPRVVAGATGGASRGGPQSGTGGLQAFGEAGGATEETGLGDAGSDPKSGNGLGGGKAGSGRGKRRGARPATLSGRPSEADLDESDRDGEGGGHSPGPRGPGPSGVPGDGGEEPPLAPLPDEVSPLRGGGRALAGNAPRPPGRLRTLEAEPGAGGDPDGTEQEPGGTAGNAGRNSPFKQVSPGGGAGAPGGGAVGEESSMVGVSIGKGGGRGGGEPPPPGGKRRWGKASGRAGIGLERKLEIHAKADRLLIGSNDAAIPVGQGEKQDELLQRVLSGIEQTTHTWGPPPANFYWLPAVKFIVYPGGNPYYERLRGPLEKLGVSSTVQYAAANTTADRPRGGSR